MASLEDLTDADAAKAYALYQFVQSNPDVARDLRKKAREKNPSMPVPDSDVLEDKFQAEIERLNNELKKRDEEAADSLKAQRRADAHAKIIEQGFDPEEVEKAMIENKIGNYDVAVKFLRQERELAPPTVEAISPHKMPDIKDLYSNRNAWARNEAFQAINELKRNRVGAR
jgi:hypothetical protein